jgi:exonuclease SbcC
MRLDRIVLKNFLSHADTTWEPEGARLVSLVGANGAGKSSLLDAVAFCLYDSARGRTDDLVRLGADDMSARVEFAFAGSRYAVERGRTRRAGGKSYLELQIADGDGWRPLTGDSIRETQDAVAALLRMDASTFSQAALLMQGRLNAFADATPGDRKRVLGQVLGLDVWARAEQSARVRARDLDARLAAERGQVERMDARLADRPRLEDLSAIAARDVAELDAGTAAQTSARDAASAAVAALDARLAAADAQRALADQLDARVAELAGRYRDAQARRGFAAAAADRAALAIGAGAGAAEALEGLPAARARLESLEALRERDAEMREQVRARREVHAAASAEGRQAAAEWTARHTSAQARVDDLAQAAQALKPVPCPKCGTPVTADGGDLYRRLDAARAELRAMGDQPPNTTGWTQLEIEANKVRALEAQRVALGFDPAAVAAASSGLRSLEALAARAGGVADAEASLAEAQGAIADAEAEMARVTRDGAAAREASDAARRELAALDPVRAERLERSLEAAAASQALRVLALQLRQAQEAAAHAAAGLAELDRVRDERDAAVSAIAGLEREGSVLRRLVSAFGVAGIPARIIEGTIPELEQYANELLSQLRPGMALSIRSQRAKKSGDGMIEALDLVVQDDAGERPLAMFSGGERMSASLALAVGLSRLVARRAGTAVRTLVVDEPDGLDSDARRSFGQALRVLAHLGELERVVLVSHHEDLAEMADAVYRVEKSAGGSSVGLAA